MPLTLNKVNLLMLKRLFYLSIYIMVQQQEQVFAKAAHALETKHSPDFTGRHVINQT